jgi:hypothetical protein
VILKKDQTPTIKFVTTVPGLGNIEELKPKPAKTYIPQWFKDMPYTQGSAKHCPALPEYFSQGYIIPMWTDLTLFFNSTSKEWSWKTASSVFEVDYHSDSNLIEHVDATFLGNPTEFVFKLLCPWNIITKKGYSVYQLPVFYEFNKDFSVLPGIIRTDIHPEINQQLLLHTADTEVTIKRGTPIAHYIPFKREKVTFESKQANKKEKEHLETSFLNLTSQFMNTGSYLRMRRELSED